MHRKFFNNVLAGILGNASFALEAAPPGSEVAESLHDKDFHGHGAALVVDDEEVIRTVAARMLSAMGFEVVLAADGREACDIFRKDPTHFALTLLDVTMPQVDGEQTLAELRGMREDARVILMSGFSKQEALARFTGKGHASFLQKPFLFETLRDLVQSVMA